MKKRSILLVIVFFISIIILSVNTNNKYLVKEESLATYIDGEKTDSFPAKGTVAFSKAECDNNTNIYWDNDTWGLYATNLNEKTKCNLYFKTLENAVTKITNLASTDTVNIASDDPDNNIRYIGANPNNYVYFYCDDYNNQTSETCELWRIIGVFNNIEKEDGTKENLIKIVRNENLGYYSWDYKSDGTVSNDWSKSTLQQLLNNGAYYNGTKGTYYNNSVTASNIDFTGNGLKNDKTRNEIESVVWTLGGSSTPTILTENWYNYERKSDVYSGNSTTWIGKISLMYPSDYGYATSGGSITGRKECLNTILSSWNATGNEKCVNNDYLLSTNNNKSLLSPSSIYSNSVFILYYNGGVNWNNASTNFSVYPTLFLKSDISIGVGDGTEANPYQLNI